MNVITEHTGYEGKKVFLRLDLNVPMKDGKILDDNRIRAALPTLKLLLDKKCRLIVASHLGRPNLDEPESLKEFSLEPVAERMAELLEKEVVLVEAADSDAPKALLQESKFDRIILLENLRFLKGEKKNDMELVKRWQSYTEVYINDAFGCSHREHASVCAFPKAAPQKFAGLLIEKELKALSVIKDKSESPFIVVLGGSKVSDKIEVIESFLETADKLLIGGAMAYTFLKAMNLPVGTSRVETDKVTFAREVIERFEVRDKEILLPMDHVISSSFASVENMKTTAGQSIEEGFMGLDIGPKTQELYSGLIRNANTVFWNGPMGVYEHKPFDKGSLCVAHAMAESDAYTVVGGGDSAAAMIVSGRGSDVSHISTGGGASLEFLEGKNLPGIAALQ